MAGLTVAIQALVAHRDALFLKRLSEDYKLDLAELTGKYLEAPAPAEKKKRVIKVKVSADGKEIRCQGMTAKKEQCSFGPLPGQCFCKRHLQADTAPQAEQPPQPSSPEEQLPVIPEEEPVTEDDQVGFDKLSPLAPLKALESDGETEDSATPRNLLEEIEEMAEREYEQVQLRNEQEQESLLELLRQQEAEEAAAMQELPAPYEPPPASPSPPKAAPKRRQSIRPKVAKKQ